MKCGDKLLYVSDGYLRFCSYRRKIDNKRSSVLFGQRFKYVETKKLVLAPTPDFYKKQYSEVKVWQK